MQVIADIYLREDLNGVLLGKPSQNLTYFSVVSLKTHGPYRLSGSEHKVHGVPNRYRARAAPALASGRQIAAKVRFLFFQ